ncbi:MAG: hypothetical protein P0Y53_23505 [Candidatus Pseudobacter hemicellulosilyticus]|uniref:Uncharacterized protein n=1 Tax=Candidatus Pseudobacter hemicellulosilyticus TaxID=3121375 RepID=A0AAJ5WQK7_9BACT|nr:MAG: hypothetical protein P0Y53_23505 [Pseudobacter sp.]
MNWLKLADGVTGLFPKKVQVVLTYGNSGQEIGKYKLPEEFLPEKYDKPTVIEIQNQAWRITKATLVRDKTYLRSRKLLFEVEEMTSYEQGSRHLAPTTAFPSPLLGPKSLFSGPDLGMPAENWRQIEFLPTSLLPVIQEEIAIIEASLQPGVHADPLLGYDSLHIRERIGHSNLELPLTDLQQMIGGSETGSVQITAHEYVQQSFFFSTLNYRYYGIVLDGIIKDLSIEAFDSPDDEFMTVLESFGLMLVDWCNARMILNEIAETPENAPAIVSPDSIL